MYHEFEHQIQNRPYYSRKPRIRNIIKEEQSPNFINISFTYIEFLHVNQLNVYFSVNDSDRKLCLCNQQILI
jgi:hypothetical protein